MTPLVAIITLNWNRKGDTLAFLASCAALAYPRLLTIVADNGSSDGSMAAISAAFPHVEQLPNGANLGFAAGMNAAMAVAFARGADYLFLANNDTTFAADCIERLVAAAEQQRADVVAPAIYYYDQPYRVWWLGGRLRPLLLEIRPYRRPPARHDPQPFPVDFVTGCGVLISRAAYQAIGGFDERFFMYYEDSDYCLRARSAGIAMLVEPRAAMYHKVAQSSGGSSSPNERYHMARSSVQYFRKHARPWQLPLIVPYRLGSAIRTVVRLARHGRPDAARAYLRGLRDGLTA